MAGSMNVLGALQRNRWANTAVKTLRIHRAVDWVLARRSLQRRTPTGLTYSVDSLPSLVVANEIFGSTGYRDAVRLSNPRTFVDLGANVGYFPLLVADVTGSRSIRGLLVEPNPNLAPGIESHLHVNGLSNVRLVTAAVGAGGPERQVDFFINPSHIASSVSGRFNPAIPVGGAVKRISVPVVDPGVAWAENFPAEPRVDLLKIDIEGTELAFLLGSGDFLTTVAAVLIEWHKWVCSFEQVAAVLGDYGFDLRLISDEDANAGTAYFERTR